MTSRDRLQRVRQLIKKSEATAVVSTESEKHSLPNNHSLPYTEYTNHKFSGTKRKHPFHNYTHYLLLPPILTGDNNFNPTVSNYPTPCSATTENDLASMVIRNNEKFISLTNSNYRGNKDFDGDDKDISASSLFSENDFLYLYTNHHILIENHTNTNAIPSSDYQQ